MTTKDITKEKKTVKAVTKTAEKKPVEKKEKALTADKAVLGKPAKAKSSGKYIEAVGRRKTSTARVRITESAKSHIMVNDKEVSVYFPTADMQNIVNEALEKSKISGKFTVTVLTRGGGVHSQAEALRHGLSRALVAYDTESRTRLKKLGFLKRDPRMKERRKFGLKKARKAPQWSKR